MSNAGWPRRRVPLVAGTLGPPTFEIEVLLVTKPWALFQRKRGRELFDPCTALDEGIDPSTVADVFGFNEKQGTIRFLGKAVPTNTPFGTN